MNAVDLIPRGGRSLSRLLSVILLLFLATLPDAMMPIALKVIAVDRYGVSAGQAHWFMAVNLIGAVAVLPLLRALWRETSPWVLISLAGVVNAACMGVMALPIGWSATLAVRALEGGADLVSISTILGLMTAGAFSSSGRRFGLAGLVMMLGLAMGAIGGGVLSEQSAPAVLLASAVICLGLSAVAWLVRAELESYRARTIRVAQATSRSRWRLSIWPALFFAFGDRGMSAAISVTGTLYLTSILDLPATRAGGLIGLSLLVLAAASWPAGWVADRVGPLRTRIVCAAFYGTCIAGMGFLGWTDGRGLTILMVVLGLSGAGLIPTTYALGSRSGGGVSDMGSIQAAGTAGYFAGVIIGAIQFPEASTEAGLMAFQRIFFGFAAGYLVLNLLGVVGLLRWQLRPGRRVRL